MNTFALEIFDDTGSQCTFYTVRWDNSDINETDKFFQKFEGNERLERPLMELAKFLSIVIAEEYGARKDFFRFENYAQALPPSGKHKVGEVFINYYDFPLRLYCLKITEHLVILFNGNEKTSSTAQKGKTSMSFHEANQFAQKILQALNEKTIIVSDNLRILINFDNSTEILL